MNWIILLRTATSFKTEIKIVLATLGVLIMLPAFAVVVAASAGLELVTKALASLNPTTHKVEVRDPNGVIVAELDATTAWPTNGAVTQEFGIPNPPYEASHSGIDIAGDMGDPVTVFMEGTATKTGAVTEGCGQCVFVDHGNSIVSHYSHLSAINVSPGAKVKPGDIIGLQGEEGWAHGVHLHFVIEVFGIKVNPRVFMVGEPQLRRLE